jgi:polyphosphate kinase
VVGRFLEHSRIYYFYNHGREIVFTGSADLMPRNLNQRVEVLFPVQDEDLIRHLRDDVLAVYLQKDIKVWEMQSDGSYQQTQASSDQDLVDVQQRLMDQY